MFDLAYNGRGEPVRVRTIGERQRIPVRYLEQIFQRLRRAELVRSKRGPGGGYTLARPAAEISIQEIVEAVEGPIGISASRPGRATPAPEEGSFRPSFLWDQLSARFAEVLAETTVEGLCRQAGHAGVARAGVAADNYQI